MCNCGRSAAEPVPSLAGVAVPPAEESAVRAIQNPPPAAAPVPPPRAYVEFMYTGATALTVVGPYSQTRYRFAHPGARLRADARDAPALAAIPKLRRVT